MTGLTPHYQLSGKLRLTACEHCLDALSAWLTRERQVDRYLDAIGLGYILDADGATVMLCNDANHMQSHAKVKTIVWIAGSNRDHGIKNGPSMSVGIVAPELVNENSTAFAD